MHYADIGLLKAVKTGKKSLQRTVLIDANTQVFQH